MLSEHSISGLGIVRKKEKKKQKNPKRWISAAKGGLHNDVMARGRTVSCLTI